ncbi:MAG: LemA family protein, partial [Pseudomonadales bacterium]|nr:LemA family protein [Pseudomonadales bacterium]
MGTTMMVVLGVVAALLLYGVAIYNKLVSYENRYKNAFAQIEVQLKRRYDLIPNLIEVAKKYMSHERETLEAVVNARNAAQQGLANAAANPGDPAAVKELNQAEGALAGALGKFNVVVEAYPELKANENMLQLSEELTSTENRVAFSRQSFNDAATLYNEYRQSFPQVVLAPMFG